MKSLSERFGVNLHHMRIKKGISQRQLAEMINFSDKAVSSWECGRGIPDIAILYQMAEFFQVKLDDFFAEETRYYLGIDGGGSKTMLALTDEDMNVLKQEITGSCNPVDVGTETALNVLKNGINKICTGIPRSNIFMFAGIAGAPLPVTCTQSVLSDFFKEFGFTAYQNDSDAINVIAAGLKDTNGISMIMDTGIAAFCQKDGVRKRTATGWGYLIDNGGSAYNIGRDGVSAHFEALDGLGTPTVISDILMQMQPDEQVLLGELYNGGKHEVAKYHSVVYAAARQQDPVAIAILRRNMDFAARVVEASAASLEEDRIPVVLSGSLTEEKDTVEYLQEALTNPKRFDIQTLSCQPVMGAVWMAKRLADEFTEGGNSLS